jgi:phosphatidate phosphatase APP1
MLILSAAVLGSMLVLSAPTTASAVGPSVVSKSTCTQGTNAMLTLSHDDGHVEAEMELHADKAGHTWKVRFYNEKVKALTVSQRTNSEDGGGTLSVSRLLTNHAGTDRITATATNQATKERCVVRATL